MLAIPVRFAVRTSHVSGAGHLVASMRRRIERIHSFHVFPAIEPRGPCGRSLEDSINVANSRDSANHAPHMTDVVVVDLLHCLDTFGTSYLDQA